jgi:hypothetical protein
MPRETKVKGTILISKEKTLYQNQTSVILLIKCANRPLLPSAIPTKKKAHMFTLQII